LQREILGGLTVSALAAEEDLLVSQSEKLLLEADAESGSVDRTSLSRRAIELKLTVGNNSSDTALPIIKDSVAKRHRKLIGFIADTRDGTLGDAGSDRTISESEASRVCLLASSGNGPRRSDDVVDALRRRGCVDRSRGGKNGRENKGDEDELHLDDG
jgi:hypothetical protein